MMLTKAQVKYIQSLHDRKFRKEYGVFIAEGPKVINEMLTGSHVEPVALYGTSAWWQQNKPVKDALPTVMFYEIEDKELEKISLLSTPNQVVGIFKQPSISPDISLRSTITLLLDGIQDPGNMGTIIRIADWFGLPHIIASKDCVNVYNPKVVQSTMGSITRVNVIYDDLSDFIVRHKHINLYASVLNGKPLSSFGKIKEGMLLIGNESKGISNDLLKMAGYHITIPKYGNAESLNAAVAAGIILSHVVLS